MYQISFHPQKGRSLVSTRPIHKGETLFVNPLLIFNQKDTEKLAETIMDDYVFSYDDERVCIPFGDAMLMNHSDEENIGWELLDKNNFRFYAVTDISRGEELCINYGYNPTPFKEHQIYQQLSRVNKMDKNILETADTLDYLKVLLASEYVLTVKVQNFHWNIAGSQFFPLHKEWGDMYDALFGHIDTIAELIRAHQEIPPASMREFLVLSIIDELTGSKGNGVEQAVTLVEDHSKLDQLCQRTITSANNQNDQVVVDIITGVQAYHQKTLWMLRSFCE